MPYVVLIQDHQSDAEASVLPSLFPDRDSADEAAELVITDAFVKATADEVGDSHEWLMEAGNPDAFYGWADSDGSLIMTARSILVS